MNGVMVSLFDYSTVMAKPWAEAGYVCYCYDMQHVCTMYQSVGDNGGMIIKVRADLRDAKVPTDGIDFIAAFPPCDHLAVSGARWFAGKGLRALAQSIELFAVAAELCEASGAPYLIENPVSTISTYWRKPDHSFDPCDYAGYPGGEGDLYTKRTCLWTGGGFVMPEKRRMEPTQGSRMHMLPPSDERKNLRSATPAGFARAVFEANARGPA